MIMSTPIKLLIGVVLILAEVAVFAQGYDFATVFQERIIRFDDPILLLSPLVLTITYAVLSKNTVSSFVFGMLSWMVFPLMILLIQRTPPSEAVLFLLLAMGIFYGLVGAVSSVKMAEVHQAGARPS